MMGPLHIEMAFMKTIGNLKFTFFSINTDFRKKDFSIHVFFLCFDIDCDSDTNNFDITTTILQLNNLPNLFSGNRKKIMEKISSLR